jgi:hypothetical protein
MQTQLLGSFEIDSAKLSSDLEVSTHLEFGDPYIEFNCGNPWKSCMVWTPGGGIGDGILAHYDAAKPCQPTANGRKLPYLQQIVEQSFAVEHLLFARLVVMSNNVLIPHRDYFEFAGKPAAQKASHRLHLPLATSDDCLFMADNVIYRMRVGEVWSLDVTEVHGAAVLSDLRRVHLALDFAEVAEPAKLVKLDSGSFPGIPESSRVERPVLSQKERDAILGLSAVINTDNFFEIFGIVIKKHFRADGGRNYVWETMRAISRLSDDPEVDARMTQFQQHCIMTR